MSRRNVRYLMAIVLGFGFLWSDLLGYTLGVVLGWGLDFLSERGCFKRLIKVDKGL